MKDLLKAIENAKVKIGAIQKDGKNPYFNSDYITLKGVITAIGSHLTSEGLALTQTIKDKVLETKITHIESEKFIYSMMPLIGDTMQSMGSAITYARRYSLVTMLNIIEADDDGNKTVNKLENDPFTDGGY